MQKQMLDQEKVIKKMQEDLELNEFDNAFDQIMKAESAAARKDPKNVFLMN